MFVKRKVIYFFFRFVCCVTHVFKCMCFWAIANKYFFLILSFILLYIFFYVLIFKIFMAIEWVYPLSENAYFVCFSKSLIGSTSIQVKKSLFLDLSYWECMLMFLLSYLFLISLHLNFYTYISVVIKCILH